MITSGDELGKAGLYLDQDYGSSGAVWPIYLGAILTGLIALLGVLVSLVSLIDPLGPITLYVGLPFIDVTIGTDFLSALFLLITGVVAGCVGLFSVGYFKAHRPSSLVPLSIPLFTLSMVGVIVSQDVFSFLWMWELMALISIGSILADYRHRKEVREAAIFYSIMTHMGFLAIMIALITLASETGVSSFHQIEVLTSGLSSGEKTFIFLLSLGGFGSKAGLVPLHAWLPKAHPEAPSPVSALLSAAMVNLGIYGILRFDIQTLGLGPIWWGVLLLGLGAVSALTGVLQASVSSSLKRLLAYSTTENMGIISMALGLGMIMERARASQVALIAFTAAIVHLCNHSTFKSLGFLSAGSVQSATGTTNLDSLGGLSKKMKTTTFSFAIASLGASGLPLGAGFVSEWLLLQALIHVPLESGGIMVVIVPLTMAALALTTGIGILAMVKAFGFSFLARARSTGASRARTSAVSMRVAMLALSLVAIVLALAPGTLSVVVDKVLGEIAPTANVSFMPHLSGMISFPGIRGTISPWVIAFGLVVASAVAGTVNLIGRKKRPIPVSVPVWACGIDALTPAMQYSATSFAEPLQRVFDDVLKPDQRLQVDHYTESEYLIQRVAYNARQQDSIERVLYAPIMQGVNTLSTLMRRAHSGNLHLYLAYGIFGLVLFWILVK